MPAEKVPPERMRLDKWLWAARFFKTRSLATQAIDNGRVRLNGERVKPAHDVKSGDRLDVHIGEVDWTLTVRALAMQRGPAPVAQALYQEDPASQVRRQRQASDRKLAANPGAAIKGRPTKRDRRLIHRFTSARPRTGE
ncbi:MAG: RNA-binding protein [Thiobacillus sp. 63-78]|uniref:RNA-binding S4 domain-containing protein n=1 Tax=Thiobacillus sp. 63-78 TaxID=1895859 RepID=UPI000961DE43|nr:RNA-binding S4 domain-containing protein [Thiobacillus sp. 63-78]MBN8774723.1 RNA-binding S4 domain-containing protein [Thiobacillus sp.]OJZ08517.1 MAG: RNA-binding protein [Thiobacillus sp. 63-78]